MFQELEQYTGNHFILNIKIGYQMKHYSNVLTQKDHYFQAISSEQEKYNTFIPGKSGRG